MPRKIEKQEVCDRLLVYATDKLDTSTFLEDGTCRIRYSNFREAMLETDLISSEPTIRSKWNMLTASRIIIPAAGAPGFGSIDWGMLKRASRPSLVARAESEIDLAYKKQKNKKTNTQEASA
jgi:hypothetical protein